MNLPPLNEKDFDAFVTLLDAPAKFNERLAALFADSCRACGADIVNDGHEQGCGNASRCEFCGLQCFDDVALIARQDEGCEPPEQDETDPDFNLFADPDFQMDMRRDRDAGFS